MLVRAREDAPFGFVREARSVCSAHAVAIMIQILRRVSWLRSHDWLRVCPVMPMAREVRDGRIVWVSFSYGFGPDLAYYGPLFAEFTRRMPGTKVLVEHDFPVENYPDLPLKPVFHFWRRHVRRVAGASAYEGEIPMPKLSVPLAIARTPADVYVLIEFSV